MEELIKEHRDAEERLASLKEESKTPYPRQELAREISEAQIKVRDCLIAILLEKNRIQEDQSLEARIARIPVNASKDPIESLAIHVRASERLLSDEENHYYWIEQMGDEDWWHKSWY